MNGFSGEIGFYKSVEYGHTSILPMSDGKLMPPEKYIFLGKCNVNVDFIDVDALEMAELSIKSIGIQKSMNQELEIIDARIKKIQGI